jgi:hypothetical protein
LHSPQAEGSPEFEEKIINLVTYILATQKRRKDSLNVRQYIPLLLAALSAPQIIESVI